MEPIIRASFSDEVSPREERNLSLAYRAACDSAVLLKNEGVLPFKGKRIAAFGAGVSRTVKGGTGSGEVNERHSVTILEGLRERGFEVMTGPWLEDYEAQYRAAQEEFKKSQKLGLRSLNPAGFLNAFPSRFVPPAGRAVTKEDIADSCTENCVYVLSRQAGEGGDRRPEKGDYYLTDGEREDIRLCAANYKHFALLINGGSVLDLGFLDELPGIGALLLIGQPGCQGGLAAADLLSGAVSPNGKLADSWARRYEDLPCAREYSSLNGDLENEYYKEGIYVGYRFFDSFGVEPRYPFGFGLGYTKFRLGKAELRLEGSRAEVRLKVRNAGRKFAGRETVQLYVSAPEGKLRKERQRLAAFAKTELLKPGESQELSLSFDLRRLASYRFEDAAFVLEPGDYVLRLGTSSRDTAPVGLLQLEREIVVSRHEHICPLRNPFLELKAPRRAPEALPERLPRLRVDPDCIQTVTYAYKTPEPRREAPVRAIVDGLSLREMAELVIGVGMFGGKRRFDMPGAVGCTSSAFWDRGLSNIALCDGPAGLRIQQRSTLNSEGKIKALELPLTALEALPKAFKARLLGDEEKDTMLYQYATAFPVEATLAQSWDVRLLEEIGRAVGAEMKEYGCTFWLAPAVNIHRNPLCGRNFEYFSEDPLLSGLLAAALTRGVQGEEGCFVTIKHFACNNQEDGRNRVSSNLSERALREIYLPAFELAVREGDALGVMSSYNRLNGVYTPNSYDLCTKVLRNEWGFEGLVMTDWYSTRAAKDGAALAMKAGNDLIMPGDFRSKADIVRAVKTGLIQKEDLERCCCNVVRMILKSATQKEYIR